MSVGTSPGHRLRVRGRAHATTIEVALRDTVYIVASAQEERARIGEALSTEALEMRSFVSAEDLIAALNGTAFGSVVVPVDLGGIGVRGLIEEIRCRHLCLTVVVIGRDDDLRAAVDIVRAGATEFVEYPLRARRLRLAVRRAVAAARAASARSPSS